MKIVIIRVDGNDILGMGHLTREIDIAKELHKRQYKIIFITKEFPHALSLINKHKFEIIRLKRQYLSIEESIAEINGVLLKIEKPDYIFIDLLTLFDEQIYLDNLKKNCKKIVIITDRTNPFYVKADFIFALSQHQNLESYSEIKDSNYYIGLKYFPLGKDYQKPEKKKIKKKIKNILVTFGGTDSVNYSTRVVKMLKNRNFKINIVLIIGPGFSEDKYKKLMMEITDNIVVKRDVRSLINYIRDCDLCICSSGNTLIELLTCGIPCIVLPQTIRENEHAVAFEKKEVIINLGLNWKEDILFSTMKKLIVDYKKRKKLSEKAQKYLDGQGLKRIIDIIENNGN